MSGRTHPGTRPLAVASGVAAAALVPALPDEAHPVAWFGRTMTRLEGQLWRDRRGAGVLYTVAGAALGAGIGAAAGSTVAVLSVCAAGRQLRDAATAVADLLDEEDLDGARDAVAGLVGRDPSHLDHAGIAAAAVESVAENMVDAVVAPAWWALIAGAPGAGMHRAANTMDAMVGHRSERYERFGWSAARLDDAMAYVPARVFAVLLAGACATTANRSRVRQIPAVVARDAGDHPSPNAGVAEAAMAAALGCQLGGPLQYGDRREARPTLGDGPRPTVIELRQAIELAERAEQLLVAALATASLVTALRRRRATRAAPRPGRAS